MGEKRIVPLSLNDEVIGVCEIEDDGRHIRVTATNFLPLGSRKLLEARFEFSIQGEAVPQTRYYTVTQEREVKVTANSIRDAVLLADAAFKGEDPRAGTWGHTTTDIRELEIIAKEDI